MVKSINNRSGKSKRHQDHELKYAGSHSLASLERWYAKITTPKAANIINIKISQEKLDAAAAKKKESVPRWRYGRDPVKVAAKRERDRERAREYYRKNPERWEMKQMSRNDININ